MQVHSTRIANADPVGSGGFFSSRTLPPFSCSFSSFSSFSFSSPSASASASFCTGFTNDAHEFVREICAVCTPFSSTSLSFRFSSFLFWPPRFSSRRRRHSGQTSNRHLDVRDADDGRWYVSWGNGTIFAALEIMGNGLGRRILFLPRGKERRGRSKNRTTYGDIPSHAENIDSSLLFLSFSLPLSLSLPPSKSKLPPKQATPSRTN